MARHGVDDNWAAGEAYESYVGRWSRLVGRAFVDWLAEPPDKRWLDVGCGTGALAQVVLEHGLASRVVGVDSSDGMLAYARSKEPHPSVAFQPVQPKPSQVISASKPQFSCTAPPGSKVMPPTRTSIASAASAMKADKAAAGGAVIASVIERPTRSDNVLRPAQALRRCAPQVQKSLPSAM